MRSCHGLQLTASIILCTCDDNENDDNDNNDNNAGGLPGKLDCLHLLAWLHKLRHQPVHLRRLSTIDYEGRGKVSQVDKDTNTSLQNKLIPPNHAYPLLEFRKLLNVLLSRIGREASLDQ